MPLLVCPNDDTGMQTIQRSGIEFDFCPKCRGVWLDRGELEKLMSAARDEGSQERPYVKPPPRPAERPNHDRRWEDDAHRRSDDHRSRRRGGFDIFDIFD